MALAATITTVFPASRSAFAGQPRQPARSADFERELFSIQQLIEANKLDAALASIATELQRYPNRAGLLNLRGVVYAKEQKLTEARADFEQAVHSDPHLTPAWQNLGRACQYLAASRNSAISCADDAWRRVLEQLPGDSEARVSLATLDLWRGKFAESLRRLEALPAAESSRASVLALRCADLAGLGRESEARQVAHQLASAPGFSDDDAATIFPVLKSAKSASLVATLVEALDSRGSASPASLRQLAVAYEQLHRLADARKTLERVALLEPQNPQHLIELARLAYLQHDFEGALGYLGHARDLAPGNPQIHFLFGAICIDMDLPVEAKKSLAKALAIDPHNPQYNYAMGSVALVGHEASDAIPYFQAYIAAQPNDPRGHFALGVAYFVAGDYARSQHEMERVRTDAKTAPGAEFYLARIARLNGRLDEALQHAERSIELMPSFAESYTELARIRLRQGETAQAQAAIDHALSLDPDSFQANATLLALYQRTHDARADRQAERLRKLDAARSARQELMMRTIEVRPY